jgi:hypothetical protein
MNGYHDFARLTSDQNEPVRINSPDSRSMNTAGRHHEVLLVDGVSEV